MKRCAGPPCKGELTPLSAFGPHGRGLQSYCRACNNSGYRQSRRPAMPVVPIPELEPDLEFDRREASAEVEEPPRQRRKADTSDTL